MNYSAFKNQSGIEKSDLRAGWIAVAIYLAVVVLFCFITFNASSEFEKKELSSGILINFGNESPGYGKVVTRDESAAESKPQVEKETPQEPVVNDNAEKAVVKAVAEKPKTKPKPKAKPKEEPKKPVVNSNALYKKKTGKSNTAKDSESHGSTDGRIGKSGSEGGEIGAPGGGGTGVNFSLSGRKLIGQLSKPDYEERIDGQIVIEIQVDRSGKVTAATFLPKNSTISSRKVIEAVRQAAMKTKFNTDQKAAFTQVGTITYILKVE